MGVSLMRKQGCGRLILLWRVKKRGILLPRKGGDEAQASGNNRS
jgi:hypothetical protein